MMTAAGVGSFTRCAGCHCSMQERSVARVGGLRSKTVGSLGKTKAKRGEQSSYPKRSAFAEGLKLVSSYDRHVVSKGSMMAMLSCCMSIDTESELGTYDKIEFGGSKVKLRLRVDHQIQFGEQVALLGSSESVGAWNDRVMMDWTEDGWVVDLEADPGEMIEFKYIIITRDGNVVWEHGENRVLVVPEDVSKSYEVVSHWSTTGEAIDFQVIDKSQATGGEATELEAEQELMSEGVDSEVAAGVHYPDNGVIPVVKETENKTINSGDFEETQTRKAVPKESKLEDPQGYENFAKPIVEDDLASSTWWSPVSIILTLLLIVYGFFSFPQN